MNKEGDGGFSISFSTVANGVAVLALVALCGAIWADHDSITKLNDKVDGLDASIKRVETTANEAMSSGYQLKGDVLGLKGEDDARRRESESLNERLKDDEPRIRDLERLYAPPRVERSGNGH